MLTLDPHSVCDVCADQYGVSNLPRSIPCGHVLCENCSLTIVEKTSPRLSPACPYCREPFTTESVRVIRVDYASPSNSANTSRAASRAASPAPRAWRSPRAVLGAPEASSSAATNGNNANDDTVGWARGIVDDSDDRPADDAAPTVSSRDLNGHRAEAKRLEDKIAVVAAKRCRPEELQTLLKDIEEWLRADIQLGGRGMGTVCQGGELIFTSLELSAALLHAILSNHKAHSEATKLARDVEASLKARCEKSERELGKLEEELKKQKALASQNKLEIAQLKSDLARLRGGSSGSTTPTPSATPMRRLSISAGSPSATPTSPETFPSSSASASAHAHNSHNHAGAPTSPTPLLRHSHARTTSLFSSSRPTTPSPASSRSGATPGMLRSLTPGPGPLSSASSSAAERERERERERNSNIPPVPPVPALALHHPHRSMTPAVPVGAGGLGRYHGRTASLMSTSHSGGSASGNHGRDLLSPMSFGVAGSQAQAQGLNVPATPNAGTNASNTGSLSRPPVPPKPRLLSGTGQSPPKRDSGSFRGVVDDRDGYSTSREERSSTREREREGRDGVSGREGKEREGRDGRKEKRHERWLPRLGMGKGINRPATSMS